MHLDSNFWVIGHRGAAAIEPENTLRGIRRAVELGVDAVEVDVRRCLDGLVVIHDATVDRTTNGSGKVSEMTFLDLFGLNAGHDERIPTVWEVLEAVCAPFGLNLELKTPDTGSLCAHLAFDPRRMLISSAHPALLREAIACNPDARLGFVTRSWHENLLSEIRGLPVRFICMHSSQVWPDTVLEAKSEGVEVLAYTVNCLDLAKRLRDMGVRGIFTDDPKHLSKRAIDR